MMTEAVPIYHEIQFPYAQGVLTGLLLTPPFPGRHPAVVLLPGSGPADRHVSYLVPVREYFARHGFAVLVCDKPGLGGSSGDWRHQTFYDRVDQARAAIAFLQQRADIHPQQIGLYGISQGAWISLLAAAITPDIPFIIPVSGPGITPLEQDLYYVEHVMRADGFAEPQIQQAVAYVQNVLTAARRGAQYAAVASQLVRPVQHEPWYRYYPIPDADMWEYFRRNAELDYDPVEWLTQVCCPVLAIFGAADLLLPVDISVRMYQTALAQAGNYDVTIKVFPDTGHLITIPATEELAPGYLEFMLQWLGQRVDIVPAS